MSKRRCVRVDFGKMPEYTRPESYEYRRQARLMGQNDGDREEDELYGPNGWGNDSEFHDVFGDN